MSNFKKLLIHRKIDRYLIPVSSSITLALLLGTSSSSLAARIALAAEEIQVDLTIELVSPTDNPGGLFTRIGNTAPFEVVEIIDNGPFKKEPVSVEVSNMNMPPPPYLRKFTYGSGTVAKDGKIILKIRTKSTANGFTLEQTDPKNGIGFRFITNDGRKRIDVPLKDITLTVTPVENNGAGVPEPLTLLGTGTALAFGAFFKRKISKKYK